MSAPDPDAALLMLSTLDSVPIIAFVARLDGRVVGVSRGWREAFGPVRLSTGGPTTLLVCIAGQGADAGAAWDAAVLNQTPYRAELMVRFGDGTQHWIACEAELIRAPHTGEISGWFGTIVPIDDLKAMHAALHRQIAFNERLIDSSEDCIKILDLEARLVSMSPNGQKLLRIFDIEALVGTSWTDFWKGEDQLAAHAALDTARAGGKGQFTGRFPVAGEPHWFDVTITAIENSAGVTEFLAVSRDVTDARRARSALQESENRYRIFIEAIPGVAWSAAPDGSLDFVSEGWSKTRGRDPQAALADNWLAAVHPEDRESVRARWRESIQTGKPYDAQFRVVMADGAYRWQLVRAHPIREATGSIVRWIGVNTDIDEQRRADEARDMFVALAENSSDFIAIATVTGEVVYVNAAGRQLLEIDSLEEAQATPLIDYFCAEDREFARSELLAGVRRDGRKVGDFVLRNFRTGARVPVAYNFFQLADRKGAITGLATVSRDRSRRERVERGFRLLSQVGAAALDSLDNLATLHNVARAFLLYASYCVIDVIGAEGKWQRVVAHRDPTQEALLAGLPEPHGDHPLARAIFHGESAVIVLDDEKLAVLGGQPERVAAADALGVRSFIAVPVVLPSGEIGGSLACVRVAGDNAADFHADDLAFVQEVGRRAGAAIANARLYQRERRIAVELQAASLPATLPRLAQFTLNAAYRPGNDEATIGGDWYDAFVLADGRVAITLGDVLGHGLRAAVTMTKLRQAMQAAAMVDPNPNVMLAVADATLRLLDPDGYATAVAAIYDPTLHSLVFASAGHPGPVVRTPDASIQTYVSPGIMLGLRTGVERDVTSLALPAGSSIVFFTDGLIEATRDIAAGIDRLFEAVGRDEIIFAANPAEAIVHCVLGDTKASDDIAVLVAQTLPLMLDAPTGNLLLAVRQTPLPLT